MNAGCGAAYHLWVARRGIRPGLSSSASSRWIRKGSILAGGLGTILVRKTSLNSTNKDHNVANPPGYIPFSIAVRIASSNAWSTSDVSVTGILEWGPKSFQIPRPLVTFNLWCGTGKTLHVVDSPRFQFTFRCLDALKEVDWTMEPSLVGFYGGNTKLWWNSENRKTGKAGHSSNGYAIVRICGGAFSFAFELLKGNSGCPDYHAMACHGLLSVENISPTVFGKQTIGEFSISLFRQLLLKTDHDNIFYLCIRNRFLGLPRHAENVCRRFLFA